jgi:serine protease AprX
MSEDRLYIKVILQNQANEQKKPGGRSEARPFKDVTKELRRNLISKVNKINDQFNNLPQEIESIPAKITLDKKALAKSHTPTPLFNDNTWSIIGKGNAEEIFVKVTKSGTKKLVRKIETGISKETEKAISTIESIEPINPENRLLVLRLRNFSR